MVRNYSKKVVKHKTKMLKGNDKEVDTEENAVELKYVHKQIEKDAEVVRKNCKKKRGRPRKNTTENIKQVNYDNDQRKDDTENVQEDGEEENDNKHILKENKKEHEENTETVSEYCRKETTENNEQLEENNQVQQNFIKDNGKDVEGKVFIKQLHADNQFCEINIKDIKENCKKKRGCPKKGVIQVNQDSEQQEGNTDEVDESCNTRKGLLKKKCRKRRRYSTESDTGNLERFEDSKESEPDPDEIASEKEAKYICYKCNDDAKMTLKALHAHVKNTHNGIRMTYFKFHKDNRPNCEICSKELNAVQHLKEHLETHSNDFICGTCGMFFKKIIEYTLHLRLHNSEEMFNCVLCEFKTDSINDITMHVNSLHSDNYEYTCKKCGKKFYTLSWLKEHEDYHRGKRSFKCSYCLKKFSYSRYLLAHKIRKHEKHEELEDNSYKCVICRKKYGSKRRMEDHMNKKHAGNLAICDICGLVLSSNENLKFHMRTHTGYKPFTCNSCGKSFTKKTILIQHVRIHTGEKPYTCEHCFKGFTQRSSLVIHIRGHTGEKPFVCHICNKAFAARALLNVHLKNGKCIVE